MKYIESKGYKISEMTLGTVQLGRAYGINNSKGMPSFEESSAVLNTALDEGINTFDTANNYGESEAVLGKFFSKNDASKTIITKIGFEDEKEDEVYDSVFTQTKECAKKLGLEKIPFVMLHSEAYIPRYGKVLTTALEDLKKEGLVDGVGVSFSRREHLAEYLLDNDTYDCIQIASNMLDCGDFASGLIEKIAQKGITVYVRSVYLQGLFFRDTNNLIDVIKCAKPSLDKLHALADDLGISMSQLAVSFMRQQKGISSLVLGAETPEQVKDSASMFDAPPLSTETIGKIMEIGESVPPVVIRPWEWGTW
ncbi:MAG: aldo/keto reductase [Clostridia bacterium]|nr:aldo/keto reductase [Clostridia bacterium]